MATSKKKKKILKGASPSVFSENKNKKVPRRVYNDLTTNKPSEMPFFFSSIIGRMHLKYTESIISLEWVSKWHLTTLYEILKKLSPPKSLVNFLISTLTFCPSNFGLAFIKFSKEDLWFSGTVLTCDRVHE